MPMLTRLSWPPEIPRFSVLPTSLTKRNMSWGEKNMKTILPHARQWTLTMEAYHMLDSVELENIEAVHDDPVALLFGNCWWEPQPCRVLQVLTHSQGRVHSVLLRHKAHLCLDDIH